MHPCPKLLPLTDFRARRTVLIRRDFGYAPKPAPPPSDMIDEETWASVATLPDDVAVRTSDHHGTTIKQRHAGVSAALCAVLMLHSCESLVQGASKPQAC